MCTRKANQVHRDLPPLRVPQSVPTSFLPPTTLVSCSPHALDNFLQVSCIVGGFRSRCLYSSVLYRHCVDMRDDTDQSICIFPTRKKENIVPCHDYIFRHVGAHPHRRDRELRVLVENSVELKKLPEGKGFPPLLDLSPPPPPSTSLFCMRLPRLRTY